VTFFITTARSGTQWVASTLEKAYPDKLVVAHEPIGYDYNPRHSLRNPDKLREIANKPSVRKHLDEIHRIIEDKSYVEVGFPAFAMAPILREEFGDRLRLVQMTRHPVKVAASVVTHDWFGEDQRKDIAEKIIVKPTDPGAKLKRYASVWKKLSSFERGLYYWYQVHAYGAELEATSRPGTFARFKFEKLISDESEQDRFFGFMGLPPRSEWRESTGERVDKFRSTTAEEIDTTALEAHPEILSFAEELGYNPTRYNAKDLAKRYRRGRVRQLFWRVKNKLLQANQ